MLAATWLFVGAEVVDGGEVVEVVDLPLRLLIVGATPSFLPVRSPNTGMARLLTPQ